MKNYISIVSMLVVSLFLLAGISWGVSLLTSPMYFFTAIGVIACAAACYGLVFGGVKKTGSGLSWFRGKLQARKVSRELSKLTKQTNK